jgi:cytochrome c
VQSRRHKTAFRGKFFAFALVGFTLPWSGVSLGVGQFGTADDAKAMLERAIAALKADPSAALKAFNDEKNKEFRDRDLFVYCFDLPDGKFTAYQSSLMLGTDVRELKLDKDPIGQRAYDVVAREPEGEFVSIDYNFPRSGTKQPATKESLETRMGNQACGVTYFK